MINLLKDNPSSEKKIKHKFFGCILQDDTTQLVQFLRNENLEFWNFREQDDYTALHKASFLNRTLAVNAILDEMAIRLGKDSEKLITIFVNEKNDQGYTALHYAAYRGNIEMINKLIENGADVNTTNLRGLTVLHMAAQGNQAASLVYFKEKYSISIHTTDDLGSTPLHWACYTGSEQAVIFLLSWSSNVNLKDKEGLAPLHLAVMSDRTRIIKKLLQHGADRELTDNKSRTACDIAANKEKRAIVEMLNESERCQLCTMKAPRAKMEKSRVNIVLFVILHIVTECVVFCGLLPCNIYYIILYIVIDRYSIGILYILSILCVIVSYIALIFSNPGLITNEDNRQLLTLVEEKLNINEFCPKCIVKKTLFAKHCLICDVCIDGFDHHCFWANNCIGRSNTWIFITFLILIIENILYNISIAVLCKIYIITSKGIANQGDSQGMEKETFPPFLTFFPVLYNSLSTIFISGFVVVLGLVFVFPLICLALVQLRNCMCQKMEKKNQAKKFICMAKTVNSDHSCDSKDSYLLEKEGGLLPSKRMTFDQKSDEEINVIDLDRPKHATLKTNTKLLSQITFNTGSEASRLQNKKLYLDNHISTTKYNIFTWFPKSLLWQFQRAANIYFLIISILTFFYFSPKNPITMVGTFALVLIFTMLKEGYEDIRRYKQDKETNEQIAYVLSKRAGSFVQMKWEELCAGDIVLILKDQDIPADLLLIYSSDSSGVCRVDTKNLDGETNLKEKLCPEKSIIPFSKKVNENSIGVTLGEINQNLSSVNHDLIDLTCVITCDRPDGCLVSWDCILRSNTLNNEQVLCNVHQLLLKGSKLKNTHFIIGMVMYTGHNTKIMKNAKRPPIKISNVMRLMNIMLYSVFLFQLCLCIFYSIAYIIWQNTKGFKMTYLRLYDTDHMLKTRGSGGLDWFLKVLTFFVAYSHLIPISLYVSLELVKIIQVVLIGSDENMYDKPTNKYAAARTSDLIEELGQVDFIFSDKTGTLTKNEMIFRKCSINSKVYGDLQTPNPGKIDPDLGCVTDKSRIDLLNSSKPYDDQHSISNNHSVNGDTRAWDILTSSDSNTADKKSIEDFFIVASVCHSAYAEAIKDKLVYQSGSPDEVALLEGADQMGFRFMKKTQNTIEIQDYQKVYQVYELELTLPFDSDRKRMSVIVKRLKRNDNNSDHYHADSAKYEYFLFTKGADSAMIPEIVEFQDKNSPVLKTALSHLERFAKEGLRTLVLAKKSLTQIQVEQYHDKYLHIRTGPVKADRDDQLRQFFKEIETEFHYVGTSAIEDKLQDNVPETIELLISAGIRLWVLTGDKKETAIEIGKSCRMVLDQREMDMIDLTSQGDPGKTKEEKAAVRTNCIEILGSAYVKYVENKQVSRKKKYMITDGINLGIILSENELADKFYKIGLNAESVICCRVSSGQKAQVVSLVKKRSKFITLGIGDGANDVPMIMEAHIGIGISGKEGTQAVMSADYAISQFCFLQRILLVHGRWGYRRISYFICYYFYKNIVLVFTEMYFAMYNGFSGQVFFPDMLPLCYNSIWTSWPCIFNYSIERDVNDKLSIQYPVLYKAGHLKYYFNLKVFWTWIVMSVIHGLLTYFLTMHGLFFFQSWDGLTKHHWFFSTIAFTILVHIVNYKLYIELKYWNKLTITVSIISFLFYYLSLFVLCSTPFAHTLNNELIKIIFDILTYFRSWIIFFLLPILILLPDLLLHFISSIFWPSPTLKIIANQIILMQRLKNIQEHKYPQLPPEEIRALSESKDSGKNYNDKRLSEKKKQISVSEAEWENNDINKRKKYDVINDDNRFRFRFGPVKQGAKPAHAVKNGSEKINTNFPEIEVEEDKE